jgi:hypothetical protein
VSDNETSLPFRWAVTVLLVLSLAASVWWARTGADEYTGPPTSREEAVARVLGSSESVTGFQRYLDGFRQRERLLAAEFRSLRAVHELLIVSEVIKGPRGQRLGDGRYIDPGVLADPVIGEGILPEMFAVSPRGGYEFTFVGREPTIRYEADIIPFRSFVYIASPESDVVGQYTFALYSEDGQIHYTAEARIPTTLDPTVTDGVAADATAPASAMTGPGLMARLFAWGPRLHRRLFTSGDDTARAEARAVADLRAFAAAQNTFLLMMGARGFASVEALNNPGTLEAVPDIAPLIDQDFTQPERDGYRYTFAGENLTDSQPRVYRDYSYVAVPTGNGSPGRRSFAIYPDGVVRVRTDRKPPLLIDPPLDASQ